MMKKTKKQKLKLVKNLFVALCLAAPAVSIAGAMGTALTSDSRIRVSDILFDENTVNLNANGQALVKNTLAGTVGYNSAAHTFNGGANNNNSIAILMDGLALDYEKDLGQFNFNVFNDAFHPMIGIRVLGKNSATYTPNPTYASHLIKSPSLDVEIQQTDDVTVHPWGLMGALYLGVGANHNDKLSFSGRAGPLLSGYDMQYDRSAMINAIRVADKRLDTSTRSVSKWGYGGFVSLGAGYQITEHFGLTAELMYSGFTSGAVTTTYYTKSKNYYSDTSTAITQTGTLKASYISDTMGMIGAQFRF